MSCPSPARTTFSRVSIVPSCACFFPTPTSLRCHSPPPRKASSPSVISACKFLFSLQALPSRFTTSEVFSEVPSCRRPLHTPTELSQKPRMPPITLCSGLHLHASHLDPVFLQMRRLSIFSAFVGRAVSAASLQFCHWARAAMNNVEMNGRGCVPKTFYLQKHVTGQI